MEQRAVVAPIRKATHFLRMKKKTEEKCKCSREISSEIERKKESGAKLSGIEQDR
jgi:hypothetical protein